jgi:hypothetical protein
MSEIIYTPHPLPEFSGNPLVEALKPLPADVIGKTKLLMRRPYFDKEELNLDSSIRRLCPTRLKNFMFPMDKHVVSPVSRNGFSCGALKARLLLFLPFLLNPSNLNSSSVYPS